MSASPRFSIDTSVSSPSSPQPSRTGYPFPDRASSLSRYQPSRRGSNASSFSLATPTQSVGGSLDIDSRRRGSSSTVRETSQNAISTLLQPPIVRTGVLPHTQATAQAAGYKAPTTRDIPPVTLTNIPHVPPESFQDYLQRIGPLFEQFQRGRSEPESQQWMTTDKDVEKKDRFAEPSKKTLVDGTLPKSPTISRQDSAATPLPNDLPGLPRRRSSAQHRRNRNEPTPLRTIPNVYFEEDFHLENPRTFDVVSERAEIVRPPPGTPLQEHSNGTPLPPRKALATNAILQEKLSWYMDTVEVHLISSISTASSGFFAALGSLRGLQEEAEQSVEQIQRLRQDLRRLDQEVAMGGLEVAAKRRKRENIRRLGMATKQVQRVVDDVKRADELVDNGQYDEAADQLDRVGYLICGENESGATQHEDLIDLRSLQALQGLEGGLKELQYRIGAGFGSMFTTTLISDMRRHVEAVPKSDTLKRWSRQRGIPPMYAETSDQLRKDLEASLKGLARVGHTTPATTAFRETVMKEMKSLVRTALPSSSNDDADSMVSISTRGGHKVSQHEKSSILASNLRAMDAEDAEKMLFKIYTGIGEALRRLSTQTKVLLDVSSRLEAPQQPSRVSADERRSTEDPLTNGEKLPTVNVQEELSQTFDLSNLLGQAVDAVQSQITKVLKVRNEQTMRLPKERFLRYFNLNRLFADECEAISGRGGQALKGVINAQIQGFVQLMGQTETEHVAHLLDSDTWDAKDFTAQDDENLQKLLGAISSDPLQWTQVKPIWEDIASEPEQMYKQYFNGDAQTNGTNTPTTNGTEAKKAVAKPAFIDETRFILVASAIQLLPTIDSFLALTASIPSMTPQISTSLLEILKTFNSRSCQLILGAGATRSAGLKNITTKHLALASQALSFVIALVPYMRECVRRHLPSGQISVLAEFDKTKRLYQDHQSGIHDKLVEIMTSRSQSHVKAMKAIDFDSARSDSDKASPYMETLTKETLTLHRVLSRHLSDLDISMIMRQIFMSYKEQWTKAFGEVELRTENGEKRLLKDAETLETRLGKIEGFEEAGRDIVGVAKARVESEDSVQKAEGKSSTELTDANKG